ncbi:MULTISPECIES: FAD/NAD(P)-binding domain-containing protein [Arthrobacter]|uniref:FAD/NAD(P)-binding protein n=1 Tax=Arthrobacter terricola TaxID=2547396 RepID=A0A4R5K678_9MICC|nr:MULTISPECIES: FAD/NAD(P)-binding protein [Arthrobacter]MBT8163091.1 FAD/NAD(P)-binding protein [Arthrobacter sp. GN70]TDF88131.1 FAD/NAD(P)-binding protein [Arthrobacter terricola]
MGKLRKLRVGLIGAGPRGTSVLERLLANWAAMETEGRSLHIDLVDPFPAGPGHVWQPGQSRLYLMNTQSFYPTLIPEDPQLAPPLAGGSFDQWRVEQCAGDGADLSAEELKELSALASNDFPSRALYGRYLGSTLDALLERLPASVDVEFHRSSAVAARPVQERTADGRAGGGFDVELDDGGRLAVDFLVLALGHLESRLNPEQRSFSEAASEVGLGYFPPAAPADVDWDLVPEAEPVLVRGMGLNFFDVMGQLTEGRGGRFVRVGDGIAGKLKYVPSGREPKIIAASRRGTPYRAKAGLDGYYPKSVRLRYLTEGALKRFATAGIQPGFDHDLWPLLHRDAVWAYYSTLVVAEPVAVSDAPEFLAALKDLLKPHAHATARWEHQVAELVAAHVATSRRLDLLGLAAPLAGRSFASRKELDTAVVDYLDDDARRSALGEADPVKMAIGALHAGRAILKTAVADGGITDETWVGELRGWFESFVEGLASGPPALRSEQLAALARAGVVSFVGPDPRFSVDHTQGVFRAVSAWVHDDAAEAKTLIEAMSPANRVGASVSAFMGQLLADGLVRPKMMMTVEGVPVQTSGLDVQAHPYRPVGANGSVTRGMYVLGLQLSSAQWGTAIAAEARPSDGPVYRSGQRTLRDADEIARDMLGLPLQE